jgi:hypothetical protein
MKQLKDTAKFQRTQWSISGSVVPLRVDDAIERIDTDQKEVKE